MPREYELTSGLINSAERRAAMDVRGHIDRRQAAERRVDL
jgi:hypothetical protein